ncbi:hypothetical protein M899_1360 [Bacteriovorax sp. BSW11_IV]|uniref:hypothetical protein n=1 Tax=Bacteriovorax sp. BSW11_IV TaxID=1353529 RepID=UPI00038A1141|nr:hypothetical protein [Bacteriovorax sp. BSW11_IV]EQC45766.1 hypothetical protein M899_1360 [Bacteriovorax sp. BSW11_IV]
MTMTQTIKDTEFLFQKLGNTWYIFAEVENEMIYSTLPEGMDPRTTKLELYEVIEDHMKRVTSYQKRRNAEAAA